MGARQIDLPNGLMGLVDGVNKRQSDTTQGGLKLRQDGTAEGLGGDASAIRYEENCAIGHIGWVGLRWKFQTVWRSKCPGGHRIDDRASTYNCHYPMNDLHLTDHPNTHSQVLLRQQVLSTGNPRQKDF
jgi:hypothetical protein